MIRFLTVSIVFNLGLLSSTAEEPAAAAKPDPVNWVTGPATGALRDFADINVPEGYRFATEDQARILFRMNNQAAPPELAGVLTPVSGKWLIVFKYAQLGYLKEEDRVDALAIMTGMRQKVQRQNELMARPGANMITMLDWEKEPDYNRGEHTLEWAIRAQTPAGTSVNHIYCALGRNGVLSAILVQPRQLLADAVPMKQLMSGITFRAGYGYADYRGGDAVSTRNLASLIADDLADEAPAAAKLSVLWIAAVAGGGLIVIAATVTLVWVMRKRRLAKLAEWRREVSQPVPVPVPVHANGSTKITVNAEVPLAANHSNGSQNGHHKTRRRRMFNYQKYYSDLLMQVSDRAYESNLERLSQNGSAPEVRKAPAGNGSTGSGTGPATVSGNLGLIESQRNLIEEQQRLIREQTKLIEEKTRLIHEKNQVLEKQAELFGNNSF